MSRGHMVNTQEVERHDIKKSTPKQVNAQEVNFKRGQ